MDPQADSDIEPDGLTPDDLLEEDREDPLNTEIGDDPLPEDNDPPAADPTSLPEDPTDRTSTTDDTHPSNDTDRDPTETYHEGL